MDPRCRGVEMQTDSEHLITDQPPCPAQVVYEPRREKTGFFAYAKTKTQISFAVTAKLISAFVFAIPLLSKPLAIFCGCAVRFVSDQVGNPEDRFSHNEAHISFSCSLKALQVE